MLLFFFLPPCLIKHGPLASSATRKNQHKATHQSTHTNGLPSHHGSTKHESFHHLTNTKSCTYCVPTNPSQSNHGPVALCSSNPAPPRLAPQPHWLKALRTACRRRKRFESHQYMRPPIKDILFLIEQARPHVT